MGLESQNIISQSLSENYEELIKQTESCDNFLIKYTKYLANDAYLAVQKRKAYKTKRRYS